MDLDYLTLIHLGPIGDGMHSRDEYVLIDSIKQRTKLSALYLYNITKE